MVTVAVPAGALAERDGGSMPILADENGNLRRAACPNKN